MYSKSRGKNFHLMLVVNWRIILHFATKTPQIFQIACSLNYTLLQYDYCVVH